jgi:hypothetical protein
MGLERRKKDEKETEKDMTTIFLADFLDLQIEKTGEDSDGKRKEFEHEARKDKNINVSDTLNENDAE